jgi:hypothetical protein
MVLVFLIATTVLLIVTRERGPVSWVREADGGCRAGLFAIPNNPLPPTLRHILGERAAERGAQTRANLAVSLNELPAEFFPATNVNVNCEHGSYDSTAVNVYVVSRDPESHFSWAKGTILTRPDAHHVLVLGEGFWSFFDQAWQPILAWREGVSDEAFLQAFGDYAAELYDFYLEWSIAHELAHMKLGHVAHSGWWQNTDQQAMETAADIEAARTMRGNYRQITPQLLGLVNETMKLEFARTYGRAWKPTDGPGFEYDWANPERGFANSRWKLTILSTSKTHPPFLLRSISMLEASSTVALEQQPNSVWSAAVNRLARRLRERIRVKAAG